MGCAPTRHRALFKQLLVFSVSKPYGKTKICFTIRNWSDFTSPRGLGGVLGSPFGVQGGSGGVPGWGWGSEGVLGGSLGVPGGVLGRSLGVPEGALGLPGMS